MSGLLALGLILALVAAFEQYERRLALRGRAEEKIADLEARLAHQYRGLAVAFGYFTDTPLPRRLTGHTGVPSYGDGHRAVLEALLPGAGTDGVPDNVRFLDFSPYAMEDEPWPGA